MFRTVAELIEMAEKENIPISEVMIRQEMDVKEKSREEVFFRNGKKSCRYGKSY